MKNNIKPKIVVESNGTIGFYCEDGERHRIDGPAVIYPDGRKKYFVNGIKQNTDEENE